MNIEVNIDDLKVIDENVPFKIQLISKNRSKNEYINCKHNSKLIHDLLKKNQYLKIKKFQGLNN